MIWGLAWHGIDRTQRLGFIGSARSCDIGFELGLARLYSGNIDQEGGSG
jgi:hypothetical protein